MCSWRAADSLMLSLQHGGPLIRAFLAMPDPTPKRGRRRRVPPRIAAFVQAQQHLRAPVVRNAVRTRFGWEIGESTIYRIWSNR